MAGLKTVLQTKTNVQLIMEGASTFVGTPLDPTTAPVNKVMADAYLGAIILF